MSETFTDFPTFPHPPGQSEGPTASTMGPKSRVGHLGTCPLEPWAGSVPAQGGRELIQTAQYCP